MNKALIISKQYPYPATTGEKMRTSNFVRYFTKLGKVDIIYTLPLEEKRPQDHPFGNDYYIGRGKYPAGSIDRIVQLLKGRPYPVYYYDIRSEKKIFSILNAGDYDYILIRYAVNAYSLLKYKNRKKVKILIDFDDMISGSLYDSFFPPTNSYYKKIIRNLNHYVLYRYEKKCMKLGASIFVSDLDKTRSAGDNNKAFVVPNIYRNELFENYNFGDGHSNDNVFLFVGTLNYEPNVEGLVWFVNNIYPELKKRVPESKILVVGHLGGSNDKKLRGYFRRFDGIELHANVDDVKKFYKRSKVVVVPLLQGGGTRIKIIEAAMALRPVISTPKGAEGLDLEHNADILFFENAEQFIRQFTKLSQKNKYTSIVGRAYDNVLSKYSQKSFDSAMDSVLMKL